MSSTDDKTAAPGRKSGVAGKDDRAARLAAALRENLARRKTQARGRKAPEGGSRHAPASPDRNEH